MTEHWLKDNRTAAPFPSDDTLHSLFEACAQRLPAAVAVVPATEHASEPLTYLQLSARSTQLARGLLALDIPRTSMGPADHGIALIFERSAEMLVAIFGTLKSGAAYVPLEPSYPSAHVQTVLEETACPLLLVQRGMSLAEPIQDAISASEAAARSHSNIPRGTTFEACC